MSLLMDALKRAESKKQETARPLTGRDDASTAPGCGFMLEPLDSPAPGLTPANPLPNLAEHQAAVDADLAATARRHPRPAAAPASAAPAPAAETKEPAAIRNTFATAKAASSRKASAYWRFGRLALACLLIGGYFWYQWQDLGNGAAQRLPSDPAGTMASQRPPVTTLPAVPVPQPPAVFSPPPPLTAAVPTGTETRRPPPTDNRPAAPTAIRIVRTPPAANSALLRGHDKLRGDSLDAARGDYEQALHTDPHNVDILLGLAAIAQRQDRLDEADDLRQRAFVVAPHDPAAQAAILNSSSDPLTSESRLKSLLAGQPESAPLNFALGNLYARQQRWSEAQQVYFNAVASDGDNPDYLFNLAVSLDHLRQGKLAAQHYRLALEAAGRRPAAFASEQVGQRLTTLGSP